MRSKRSPLKKVHAASPRVLHEQTLRRMLLCPRTHAYGRRWFRLPEGCGAAAYMTPRQSFCNFIAAFYRRMRKLLRDDLNRRWLLLIATYAGCLSEFGNKNPIRFYRHLS